MKNRVIKQIPKFKNEDSERDFWSKNDFSDYLESFVRTRIDLSELKPSTRSVTLRMPEPLLLCIKRLADERDVPYQSLMKVFLAEKVRDELKTRR